MRPKVGNHVTMLTSDPYDRDEHLLDIGTNLVVTELCRNFFKAATLDGKTTITLWYDELGSHWSMPRSRRLA